MVTATVHPYSVRHLTFDPTGGCLLCIQQHLPGNWSDWFFKRLFLGFYFHIMRLCEEGSTRYFQFDVSIQLYFSEVAFIRHKTRFECCIKLFYHLHVPFLNIELYALQKYLSTASFRVPFIISSMNESGPTHFFFLSILQYKQYTKFLKRQKIYYLMHT